MNLARADVPSPNAALRSVDSAQRGLARPAALALGGSLLIALGAQVAVPLWPVPITLQTMAVAVVAATLGWRTGVAAVALYLLQGALGLPVFANASAGIHHLVGPTAGYLAGFLVAAAVVGWLADRGAARRWVTLFPAMLLGDALVLTLGGAWLSVATGEAGFWAGIAPFMPGALVKSAAAAAIVAGGLRRRLR